MNRSTNISTDNSSSENSAESSDFEDELRDLIIVHFIMEYERSFIDKISYKTSILTGRKCILEFLARREIRCYESFRMKKDVFLDFCYSLRNMSNLKDGKKVSVKKEWQCFS